MPPSFRRPLSHAEPSRRPPGACADAPRPHGNRLSSLVLALVLFDHNPAAMATQVRAWLAEGGDV